MLTKIFICCDVHNFLPTSAKLTFTTNYFPVDPGTCNIHGLFFKISHKISLISHVALIGLDRNKFFFFRTCIKSLPVSVYACSGKTLSIWLSKKIPSDIIAHIIPTDYSIFTLFHTLLLHKIGPPGVLYWKGTKTRNKNNHLASNEAVKFLIKRFTILFDCFVKKCFNHRFCD